MPQVHELLRTMGGDHLAVFCSSFSKTVAPGLRVGYVILPEPLVGPFERLATRMYVSPPLLAQAQLHDFLAAGRLEPQLEFLSSFLRPRRDALLEELAARMPEGSSWTRPDGGYFLWLTLAAGLDTVELRQRASASGVAFVPGRGLLQRRARTLQRPPVLQLPAGRGHPRGYAPASPTHRRRARGIGDGCARGKARTAGGRAETL